MSVLGFEVHVDKENATPAVFTKGSSVKTFGPRNKNKLAQPTPRKALNDVHNDLHLSSSRAMGGKSIQATPSSKGKDAVRKQVKPTLKISQGVENLHSTSIKKQSSKKSPSTHKRVVKKPKDLGPQSTKAKVVNTVEQPSKTSMPDLNGLDEEYDSDSIFPRAERLSSYMDKLLMWRPPCLFGTIPDSESEDEPEPGEFLQEEILPHLDSIVSDMPEYSLSDLPPPVLLAPLPAFEDNLQKSAVTLNSDNLASAVDEHVDSDLMNITLDKSLPLGSLHMMDSSPDTSGMDPEGDLGLHSPSI